MNTNPKIVTLPVRAKGMDKTPVWQIAVERAKEALGRMMRSAHVPGFVKDVTYQDPLTGHHIEIRANVLFTRISVDGRDYYFSRFSGRFDGTGMGCS